MREIKFRAMKNGRFKIIDLSQGQAWSKELLRGIADGAFSFEFDTPLEQLTGLKDKNGKEIYEGDLVRWNSWDVATPMADKYTKVSEVVWHKGAWKFRDQNAWNIGLYDNMEVIGNIHTTPDLLEDDK